MRPDDHLVRCDGCPTTTYPENLRRCEEPGCGERLCERCRWRCPRHSHLASDGSRWAVSRICPPVPSREFDWEAYRDDLVIYGPTREACVAEVEERVAEQAEVAP